MFSRKLGHIVYLFSIDVICLMTIFTPLFVSVKANESQALEVSILFPAVTAPVTTTSGEGVDVTFEITGASADYHIVSIAIAESGTPDNIIGEYTQLVRLNTGTKTITRMVDLSPGTPDGFYDVIVRADLAEDFDSANSPSDTAESAVVVGDIQGLSQGALVVGKSLVIVGALFDQWVPSSNLNEFYMTGNAGEALTDVGMDIVDNISKMISEELAGAGDVVGGTKGNVVSEAPGIIDGTLSLVSDIVEFFSTKVPLEP